MRRLKTDILIPGSGGAGLFAALHAQAAAPDPSVTVAREDSRDAHFLSDHPGAGDPAASRFTSVRRDGSAMVVRTGPVRFTRVEPGETPFADSAAG